jgi:hypothetical protein
VASFAPDGLGGDWPLHTLPFQLSTRPTFVPPLFLKNPVAMHALADEHETPKRSDSFSPSIAGTVCKAQLVPFQRIACAVVVVSPLRYEPTAVQAFAAVHDTALRYDTEEPPEFGVLRISHFVPSQCMASVF